MRGPAPGAGEAGGRVDGLVDAGVKPGQEKPRTRRG